MRYQIKGEKIMFIPPQPLVIVYSVRLPQASRRSEFFFWTILKRKAVYYLVFMWHNKNWKNDFIWFDKRIKWVWSCFRRKRSAAIAFKQRKTTHWQIHNTKPKEKEKPKFLSQGNFGQPPHWKWKEWKGFFSRWNSGE